MSSITTYNSGDENPVLRQEIHQVAQNLGNLALRLNATVLSLASTLGESTNQVEIEKVATKHAGIKGVLGNVSQLVLRSLAAVVGPTLYGASALIVGTLSAVAVIPLLLIALPAALLGLVGKGIGSVVNKAEAGFRFGGNLLLVPALLVAKPVNFVKSQIFTKIGMQGAALCTFAEKGTKQDDAVGNPVTLKSALDFLSKDWSQAISEKIKKLTSFPNAQQFNSESLYSSPPSACRDWDDWPLLETDSSTIYGGDNLYSH